MLLAPSLSPSSEDSPAATSTSLPQPLPVEQPPLASAVFSPPSPPTVVSPPPLAPISTPAAAPPLPSLASPPPAAVVASPVTLPQPPTPPIVTSPPATTSIIPPSPPPAAISVSPIASPPPFPSPPLVTASPVLPITPTSRPQPPTFQPSTSPLPSPTPPTRPSFVLPPPAPVTRAPSLPPPSPPTDPLSFTDFAPEPLAPYSTAIPKAPESSEPFPLPAPPPPLPLAVGKGDLPTGKQGSDSPIGLIVACIGLGILLFLVFAAVYICCRRRKQKLLEDNKKQDKKQECLKIRDAINAAVPTKHEKEKVAPPGSHVITVPAKALPPPTLPKSSSKNSGPVIVLNISCGIFNYDELVVATNGFSVSNLLGEGGFGYVHKGVLPSGQEVAVKQLKAGSHQGEREFQAEVETISRVHHKHLVSLVGYCITGAERLLVYEFVPNKTLEFHLRENNQLVMNWENRLKIAIGSAKGIAYLHEDCSPTIIHRDIKAANILLEPRFEAKVSDFGLAKIFPDASSSSSITHISTRVVGTFGYLAPEYASTGKLTDKSDVYSYGVVLLELITGRPPITKKESSINESLVDYARPLLARALEDNDFDALADPKLRGEYNKSEMASMVACAAACIRHSAWLRPRMNQVVRALEGNIDERSRSWNSSTYTYTSSETMIQNAH